MSGDLLGRVAPEGIQLFQFVILRNAGDPVKQPPLLPFVGWFTVDSPFGYSGPPDCKCKFILRADDRTFKAFYEAAGKPLPADHHRHICLCYGHFLE